MLSPRASATDNENMHFEILTKIISCVVLSSLFYAKTPPTCVNCLPFKLQIRIDTAAGLHQLNRGNAHIRPVDS